MHDVHTHMYTLAQVLLLQVVVSEDAIVIAEVHARFHIEGGCPGIPPLQNSQRLIPPSSPLLPFHLLLTFLFLLLLSHHPSFLPSQTTFKHLDPTLTFSVKLAGPWGSTSHTTAGNLVLAPRMETPKNPGLSSVSLACSNDTTVSTRMISAVRGWTNRYNHWQCHKDYDK